MKNAVGAMRIDIFSNVFFNILINAWIAYMLNKGVTVLLVNSVDFSIDLFLSAGLVGGIVFIICVILTQKKNLQKKIAMKSSTKLPFMRNWKNISLTTGSMLTGIGIGIIGISLQGLLLVSGYFSLSLCAYVIVKGLLCGISGGIATLLSYSFVFRSSY